jgi:hypothetical protein
VAGQLGVEWLPGPRFAELPASMNAIFERLRRILGRARLDSAARCQPCALRS